MRSFISARSASEADLGDVRPVGKGLVPAIWGDPELASENRCVDLRLVLTESGDQLDPIEELASGRHAIPQPRDITLVRLDEVGSDGLNPFCHVGGEAVQRGLLPEHRLEPVGIEARDRLCVERGTEALLEHGGPCEGLLDGDLLVQGHAHDEGEVVVGKQLVGFWCVGEVDLCHDKDGSNAEWACRQGVASGGSSIRIDDPGGLVDPVERTGACLDRVAVIGVALG